MTSLSTQEAMVVDELRKTSGDVTRVSRRFDLQASYVRNVVHKHNIETHKKTVTLDIGRSELRRYIVATKYVLDEWDNSDPAIKLARLLYDQGKTEMVTGRHGDTSILYSIPRRTVDRHREAYFDPKPL